LFKGTWLPNTFTGIIASLAFSVIVLVMAMIYQRDPSLFALFKAPRRHPSRRLSRPATDTTPDWYCRRRRHTRRRSAGQSFDVTGSATARCSAESDVTWIRRERLDGRSR
jgi:hypothetical protein